MRLKRLYQNNFNNYYIVIDSSYITPESLADFVIEKLDKWKNGVSFPKIWLSPKNIYPLQGIREHSDRYIDNIKNPILQKGFNDSEPIEVIQKEGDYYIYITGTSDVVELLKLEWI